MQASAVVCTGNKVKPPRSDHPIWEDLAVAYKNQTEPGLISDLVSFTFLKRIKILHAISILHASFDMWNSMSFLKLKLTVAELAQSVEHFDCRAGGRGFNSQGQTNTQGLKTTEKWRYPVLPLHCNRLDLRVARMTV